MPDLAAPSTGPCAGDRRPWAAAATWPGRAPGLGRPARGHARSPCPTRSPPCVPLDGAAGDLRGHPAAARRRRAHRPLPPGVLRGARRCSRRRSTPVLRPPAWERTAMVFGAAVPGAAGHPLFVPVFVHRDGRQLPRGDAAGPGAKSSSADGHPARRVRRRGCSTPTARMRTQRTRELARFRELRDRELEHETQRRRAGARSRDELRRHRRVLS